MYVRNEQKIHFHRLPLSLWNDTYSADANGTNQSVIIIT